MMLLPKLLILTCLICKVKQQPHGDSGCASLNHAHATLCPSQFATHNSHALQGPSGKKGPPGPKGQKGSIGSPGEKGSEGRVNYKRLDQLVEDRMKQDIGCSIGLKGKLNSEVTIISPRSLSNRTEADSARLDEQPTESTSGSWCGRSGARDWIEIKFKTVRLLAGIVTQGNPSTDQWVKTFTILCGDERGGYTEYTENRARKIFQANSDRNTKAFNIFADVISCRSIRIVPTSWKSQPCLRMELLHGGCYASQVHKFYVKSQGADDGWTCHIIADGVDKAVRRRGFCVVIFNPATGIFQSQTFDAHGQPADESARMIQYLDNANDYSIVSIAVGDAASRDRESLQPALITVLQIFGAVGVSCDLKSYGYRDSFAFIGQKMPNNSERPSWVSCQHVKRHGGYAAVHATIKTSRYFVHD